MGAMKALATTLRILSLFATNRSRWGVSEIANELGLGKSVVSKNLASLRAAEFLERDEKTRLYSPGIRSFALGAQYLNNSLLVREAGSVLRRLADETKQTSTLCTLHGLDVLHLASVEGADFLDVGWRVGTWLPFHATAVGKVLFAFAEADLLERAVALRGLESFTATTICDAEQFSRQLVEVRNSGYSETFEETMVGLAAQAVPVVGADGGVIAALGLIFPSREVDRETSRRFLKAAQDGARAISLRMGAQVYPFAKVAP
jgi:DNA-binding IclR family transcriptional regulator